MSSTLSPFQQSIIPIAISTSLGDMQQLTQALDQGLDQKMPISMIKEIMVHLYAYIGFPRSLNALTTLLSVIKHRQALGKKDIEGEAEPIKAIQEDSLQLGSHNQTTLVGQPVKSELFEFCPAIDQFLKAHLFGDLFERPQLSWQDRELSTISALSVMSGVSSQLKSHFRISLNAGITIHQLHDFITTLRENTRALYADTAENTLLEALEG